MVKWSCQPPHCFSQLLWQILYCQVLHVMMLTWQMLKASLMELLQIYLMLRRMQMQMQMLTVLQMQQYWCQCFVCQCSRLFHSTGVTEQFSFFRFFPLLSALATCIPLVIIVTKDISFGSDIQ